MEINPKLNNTIYKKRIKDSIALLNYNNPNGIVLIKAKALPIIELCNGNNDLKYISKKLKIRKEILKSFIEKIENYNIINTKNQKKEKNLYCWLHITNDCNLNCRYCYINKSKSEMDFETAKKIINKLFISAKKNNYSEIIISFSGGEPLLKKELIVKIVNYCNKKNAITFSYRILTNGTLIDQNFINFIKKNNINIRISLDGINKYNDKNRVDRNNKGSYNDVIRNILLLKQNEIIPTINTVITRENVNGLKQLTKKLIKLGVPFRYSLEKTNSNNKPEIAYIQNKTIKILTKSLLLIKKEIKKNNMIKFSLDDIKFNNNSCKNCKIGQNLIAINEKGEFALCGMNLNNTICNIENEFDIIQIINEEKVSKFNIEKNNYCNKCIWLKICNGGCPLFNLNINGDLYSKNLYCKLYKRTIPILFEIEALKILNSTIKSNKSYFLKK